MSVDLTLAREFVRHWSVDRLVSDDVTFDQALTYLAQDEVIDFLDEQSAKLAKIYSRVPPHLVPMVLMGKLSRAATATESASVMNAFSKWFSETPAPSEREFAKSVLDIMTSD